MTEMTEMTRNTEKLHVPLGGRSYDILIRPGGLDELPVVAASYAPVGEAIALICDETVWELYGRRVSSALRGAGMAFECIPVPPGEGSKRLDQLARIYNGLAGMGLGRNGLIVALGGGVTGDLAGFAAATWMRGVSLVQVPTTLLAQVDSSVGGKTAIDIDAGKNLVGAFHQPKAVLIDPQLIETLPARERAAGMSEVIKYGAIASETLFAQLESRRVPVDPAVLPGNPNAAPADPAGVSGDSADIICACCRIKRDVVAEDEFDAGRRMILNFGHTFGHAIEAKYGYGRFNHGEAVAGGMRIAAGIGEILGVTARGTARRLSDLLSRYGLDAREDADDLIPIVRRDKKATGRDVKLVLLKGIGEAVVERLEYPVVEAALRALRDRGGDDASRDPDERGRKP
ncbi:MAG: 3-dehydroquinate synthase [Clostridiales Family XIII bacterium]|jgi:3-dehydroquinate synthase|nr:3-dehydroquinate synthase [Clostridiales Family XIII bacterium]